MNVTNTLQKGNFIRKYLFIYTDGYKTMTDFQDYSLPNFYGINFYLPQNNFMTADTRHNFSIWNNCTFPNFMPLFTPQFNIFDFSFNNFSFPQINLTKPLFSFPTLTQTITPTIQQSKPTQTVTTAAPEEISFEPEETDFEASRTVTKTEKKNNTRSAASGLNSSLYIAEEIVPGYYVQKGKYLNTKDLKPYMKEAIVKMDKKAKELGYTLVIIDGFRSHATQAAAKKRKPKLCAPAGKSAHEYGVAVDVALFKNGKQVGDIKRQVPEFGRYAQSLGLEWGANWRTKYEPWHFNFNNWTNLADVRDEYRRWNHLA